MNRLGTATSPYLRQHRDNPVAWHPWDDEAFAVARREDKPVFLSIGYSTCHWCHVMAHESFEDADVARVLNRDFVAIKVDREERPDIDQVYMAVCQAFTGSGGWPLTIIMTPERLPFYAATYVPRTARYGRPGLLELLPQIAAMWQTQQRARLIEAGEEVRAALARSQPEQRDHEIPGNLSERAIQQMRREFDSMHGGFGAAPKFPMPATLRFLINHLTIGDDDRAGATDCRQMVEQTLQHMAAGGIYDHLGGGFCRYSVDAAWQVPHFEKMLYDNALLAVTYLEAYQGTGANRYAEVARDILAYADRVLAAPDGGWFSAENADSDGVEGKYYVFTDAEFRRAVGDDIEILRKYYGVTETGNFDHGPGGRPTAGGGGPSVLQRPVDIAAFARAHGLTPEALTALTGRARQQLLAVRAKRIPPSRDDKILTAWNALMISALAKAGTILGEPRYVAQAEATLAFIQTRLQRGPRLAHGYCHGVMPIAGFLDDYVFLTAALLDLYEATWAPALLHDAALLHRHTFAAFADADTGVLHLAATDAEPLLFRPVEGHDGALPSANGIAASNGVRLARITGDLALATQAERLVRAFAGEMQRMPSIYPSLVSAAEMLRQGLTTVVVAATDRHAATPLLAAAQRGHDPYRVLLFRPTAEPRDLERVAPWTANHVPINGRPTAWVCREGACLPPTHDPRELAEQLRADVSARRPTPDRTT